MLLHIATADNALGRCDPSSLSDQTIMELLVAPIIEANGPDFLENSAFFGPQTADGTLADACSWVGVRCAKDKSVAGINWEAAPRVKGTISLDVLPQNLNDLNLSKDDGNGESLTGTIETSLLPRSLKVVSVMYNAFFGTLDLTSLPEPLEYLMGRANRFCGSIDLTRLPKRMCTLSLSENQLRGTISLCALPETLRGLYLDRNALHGTVTFEKLPRHSIVVNLKNNAFEVEMEKKPFLVQI